MATRHNQPEASPPNVPTQVSGTQRRYRTLAVVKQEAITRVEKPLEDSVFVWPHLLAREFFAATSLTVMITLLSITINAPLKEAANGNLTPASTKAPWYFLGAQELLAHFPGTTGGLLIPIFTGVALVALPYVDRTVSRAYADRKIAIIVFTMMLIFYAVITLVGSFFRGPGWHWIWPWQQMYFDL